MSRTTVVVASLIAAANRVQEIVPEDHHYFGYYNFIQTMIASVNRELSYEIEQSDGVLTYLENIITRVNEAVNSYELFEVDQSESYAGIMSIMIKAVVSPLQFLNSIPNYYWQDDPGLDMNGVVYHTDSSEV